MKTTFATLLFFLAGTNLASACSCLEAPPPAEKCAQAAAVFVGRVVDVAEKGAVRRYEFKVVERFKGTEGDTIFVESSGSGAMCGSYFNRAGTYLVYANGKTDRLTTSLCMHNWEASSAGGKAEIEVLRHAK